MHEVLSFSSSNSLESVSSLTNDDEEKYTFHTPELKAFLADLNIRHKLKKQEEITETRMILEVDEPTRYLRGPVCPPKRFFRTFWRSLARKALKQGNQVAGPMI